MPKRPTPTGRKQILYYAPERRRFERFFNRACRVPGCEATTDAAVPVIGYRGTEIIWFVARDTQDIHDRLDMSYAHLLLLDLRWTPRSGLKIEDWITETRGVLEELDRAPDVERRFGFDRILVLVAGPDPDRIDRLLLELGGRGICHVIRQRWAQVDSGPSEDEMIAFTGRVLDEAVDLVSHRYSGKVALCAAGGGITGAFYELGTLKCLDDCLGARNRDLPPANDFDMYFGISAGAFVTGLLAVGYSVEEFMAGIAAVPGGRIKRLRLDLVRLKHLNFRNLSERLTRTAGTWRGIVEEAIRRRERAGVEDILLESGGVLGPPFRSDGFERVLRHLFDAPWATNDFRQLPRPLYVGTSDQDLREHVLFGSAEHRTTPISRAIQASMSIHPAFSATEIDGRFYEDGAVTRTSNFAEAINRGASLLIVLDPFVPYVSKVPGEGARQGLLYNIDQDIRTISFTRYAIAQEWVLRQHPEVSSYTFVPSNRLRRLLSANPMDHRPYLEIWRGAYLSTLRRIEALIHRMQGDIRAHGLSFDIERAQVVAKQLRSVPTITFADFFPDRKIEIRQPPLCLDPRRVTTPEARAGIVAHSK